MIPASWETNLSATSRAGTTLTASGTPHAEGAWVELLASTAATVEKIAFRIRNVAVNATDTGMLVDLATGAAASEAAFLNNLDSGGAEVGSASTVSQGRTYSFPKRIAASTRVSARPQATVASDTAEVAIMLGQGCVHVENVGNWVTYGANAAASIGTSTPQGSGAYGAWTEIGTTSEAHNLFFVGFDALADTTTAQRDVLVKIGYGATAPGSGGTEISAVWHFGAGAGTEAVAGPFPDWSVYAVVGSGVKLWAAIASGETENRGIIIYGATGTVVTAGGGFKNFYPGQS